MPMLDRDGVRIHYEVTGEGPALLLTHGYSATGEMWQGQLAALSPFFKVITWDMRGHGASDYPQDQAAYSEAATVADMAALLDAAGAESAVIGGLSLGGYMSLAFHRAHPERTRALLGQCMASMDQHLSDIRRWANAGDPVNAKRAAHDLKGICAQFGAARASAIARRIELEVEDPEVIENIVIELAESLTHAEAKIQEIRAGL